MAPSSGWPDHDEAPNGSVADPTYTSRITWVDDQPIVSGPRPAERQHAAVGGNVDLTDAQWVPQATPIPALPWYHQRGSYWYVNQLSFDVEAYLISQYQSRLQWQPDPALADGMTFERGIDEVWPGEGIRAYCSPRNWADRRIGYRSAARQRALT